MSFTVHMYAFFFFFSSRRRHTRFDCDWSSDVCSSDLGPDDAAMEHPRHPHILDERELPGDLGRDVDTREGLADDRILRGLLWRPLPEIGRASCRERV